jgi:hypothetical protein
MSTVYKFRSQIREQENIEFYQTPNNQLGIVINSDINGILVSLSEEQLFELIGSLLRIQSKIKSKQNGGE